MREILERFHNDLSRFRDDCPILVTYRESTHELIYSQFNITIIVPYLKNFYLRKRGFTYGVLTQNGRLELLKSIKLLIENYLPLLESNKLVLSIEKLRLDFYGIENQYRKHPYPKKVISLELVTFSNRFLSKLYLNMFSTESKLLLKNGTRNR